MNLYIFRTYIYSELMYEHTCLNIFIQLINCIYSLYVGRMYKWNFLGKNILGQNKMNIWGSHIGFILLIRERAHH